MINTEKEKINRFSKKSKIMLVLTLISICIIVFLYYLISGREWYKRYPLIAHALGQVDEYTYTNCKEAFLESYKKGFRVFEVDFLFTSDGHAVLRHKWDDSMQEGIDKENIPDYDTFMNTPIYGQYTPLAVEDLIDLMAEYKDIWIVTDSKEKDYLKVLSDIVEAARNKNKEEVLKRFIIQFYRYAQLDEIKPNFSFEHFIFTIYDTKIKDYEELGKFCEENDIDVLTMPKKKRTKENIDAVHQYDVTIFTHTLNTIEDMKKCLDRDIEGFYTDMVLPDEFNRYMLKRNIKKLIPGI